MAMSGQSELLWLGAALLLLLLLGMVAGLCVRCPQTEPKRPEKIYEQRSLQEGPQSFAVARTYSLVRPLGLAGPDQGSTRKDKLLEFPPNLQDPASSRYQHFSRENRTEPEASYQHSNTADYYNWGPLLRPQEDDDDDEDTGAYENVLICKPKAPESGGEDSEDYQNSASIHLWHKSRRIKEQGAGGAVAPFPPESPDEDSGEPDYVNQDPAVPKA
ncbi:linker for activation of T-cells family member 2 isoform X1 [Ochotona curzoniae]|uniref:linker for activation of T-cells family member 2 isoform X1 n=1 Tax=Ochotona curzoniae TaxID=130825 RepID=UPI001B34DE9C|nr:linker for activation of T-cells family member 2 isoform X1 [Ochotona curzoniae]